MTNIITYQLTNVSLNPSPCYIDFTTQRDLYLAYVQQHGNTIEQEFYDIQTPNTNSYTAFCEVLDWIETSKTPVSILMNSIRSFPTDDRLKYAFKYVLTKNGGEVIFIQRHTTEYKWLGATHALMMQMQDRPNNTPAKKLASAMLRHLSVLEVSV